MQSQEYQAILFELRERKRRESFNERDGRIHEVKGDKMRVVIGGTEEEPMLSPWLDTSDHRGGSRERDFYRKGQNVRLSCPSGDLRQATVAPAAPSEHYSAPDHADSAGDAKTFQLGKVRHTHTADTSEVWLADSGGDQPNVEGTGVAKSSGNRDGGQSGLALPSGAAEPQQQQQQKSAGTPASILRQNADGGITGRIAGDNSRFAAHKEGSKLKIGTGAQAKYAVITKKACIVKEPWTIDKDPVPDDDSHVGG